MKVEIYTKDHCIWCDRAKGLLNAHSIDFEEFDLSNDEERVQFYEKLGDNVKTVPQVFINEKGLSQISDEGELEKLVDNVISSNPENVEKYKNGKDKLFGFFVGEAMKLSKGKANPKVLNELLKSKLNT